MELDFHGMYPHLLYAQEGIQLRDDPYSMVDSIPELRPFLKVLLLAMLHSKTAKEAKRAASKWLLHHPATFGQLKRMGIAGRRGWVREMANRFLDAHAPIAHYFCNGKETGLRIMNKEAAIALGIIDHFTSRGIPILAVHDSFRVQTQYRDELCRVMKAVYRKHTGFCIPVQEK